MKDFRRLYNHLDSTTSTNIKVDSLTDYFRETHPSNAAWGLHLLLGKHQRRIVTSRILRETFLINFSDFPEWLLEESYGHVGDTAETVTLLLATQGIFPNQMQRTDPLSVWMEERIPGLSGKDIPEMASSIFKWWKNTCSPRCSWFIWIRWWFSRSFCN